MEPFYSPPRCFRVIYIFWRDVHVDCQVLVHLALTYLLVNLNIEKKLTDIAVCMFYDLEIVTDNFLN